MNPYDLLIRVAQRFLYGYLHHTQMASFFDLLKMPITADNQRKNAFMDAQKRAKLDEYITQTFEKIPLYTVSNLVTVAMELKDATYENIKQDKKTWLKKGIEALARYEKDTIAIFEELKKLAENSKEQKIVKYLEKFIKDAKEELGEIEHFFTKLQESDFDYEKYKEKEKQDMPRRYYDDPRYDHRRRQMDDDRYEPMGDYRFMPYYMDDMDDDDMDDRFYPYLPFMDDDRQEPMYDRRGVPGTGRGRRRRRYR